jgi:rhodanese-related sulfurtransferase
MYSLPVALLRPFRQGLNGKEIRLKSLIRILFGAVAIMAFSTLIGIIHNAARSRPIPLMPQLKSSSPINAQDSGEELSQTQGNDQTLDASGEILNQTIVSVDEVKSMLDDPYVFIIDARDEEEYGEGHIPGAVNVPYDRFVDFYNYVMETIPTEAKVVCYCRSETCDFSDHLAEELRIAGYENVFIFRDGWDAWVEAGNEVERE